MRKLTLIMLFVSYSSFALNVKVRAREHFENHIIELDNGAEAEFSGFSNTINIWHEVPYKYSIGLSVSPIIGKLKAKNDQSEQLVQEKVNFKAYGFEGKYYPIDTFYLRHGIYAHEFDDYNGWGLLTTVGYEYPFDRFGLAFEGGKRWYSLGDVKGDATSFAIGFHFYNFGK